MLQGHWKILKRGMKIGLGKVPGVAGLGKKTEIREMEFPDQLPAFLQPPFIIIPLKAGMDKNKTGQSQAPHQEKYQKCCGLPNHC